MVVSSAKLGKKKSAIGLDDLLCLARWVGQKTTPFDLKDLVCKFSLDRSAERDGLVKANSIAVFIVNCLRLKSLLTPRPLMC